MPPTESEQKILAGMKGVTLPGKKRLVAKTLADDDADWIKMLLLGPTGSGKTFSLVGVLESLNREGKPNKLFVASTDLGGNGLRSVKQELRLRGRTDLLANLAWYEFQNYEEFAAFTTNPAIVEVTPVNGTAMGLWQFDPDVLAWDGMSSFQESHVWSYVMGLTSIAKAPTEAREAGVQADQVDWGQIRRVTILQLDDFLLIHNPNGKKIHKLCTCILDDGKEDKLSGETKRGPLIQGAARSYMVIAFDAILTCAIVSKPGVKVPEYMYKCDPGGTTVAKKRGLPIEPNVKADMGAVWTTITSPAKP